MEVGIGGGRSSDTLESEILAILNTYGALDLKTIVELVNRRRRPPTTSESVRKALEKLQLRGLVISTDRGKYAVKRSLEDYLFHDEEIEHLYEEINRELEIITKIKPQGLLIGRELRDKLVNVMKLTQVMKVPTEFPLGRLEGLFVGGAAVDESIRSIRSIARTYSGGVIGAYARLRLGAVAPFEVHIEQGGLTYAFGDVNFWPEGILNGDLVEFVVRKVVEPRAQTLQKLEGLPPDMIKELMEKFSEYDIIEFNLELANLSVDNSWLKSPLTDYNLALVDGSIIPGHLDPHITPYSDKIAQIEREQPDVAKELLRRKAEILRGYWRLYERVRESKDIILIGAVKNSMDSTLQLMTGIYYDAPDQKVLSEGGLEEGEVLGPIRKHRLREWVKEVEAMDLANEIPPQEPPIETYYVMSGPQGLPLQVDAVFPEDIDRDKLEKRRLLSLIYYMAVNDKKHTELSPMPELYVRTLKPIAFIDEQVSERAKVMANIVSRELEAIVSDILDRLAYYANKYGIDFAIFAYNVFKGKLVRTRG